MRTFWDLGILLDVIKVLYLSQMRKKCFENNHDKKCFKLTTGFYKIKYEYNTVCPGGISQHTSVTTLLK